MKKVFIGIGCLIAGTALALGAFLGVLHLTGNIHTVIPKQVYRSEHLSAARYQRLLQKYNIKTVLGLAPMSDLNQEERIISRKHGVYIYFPMHAMGKTSLPKLKKLTSILMHARRPLLIHCKSGSDRTGLASAVVLILDNAPIDKAMKQVDFVRYGIMNGNSTGRVTLRPYVLWLSKYHLPSSRQSYLNWLYKPVTHHADNKVVIRQIPSNKARV